MMTIIHTEKKSAAHNNRSGQMLLPERCMHNASLAWNWKDVDDVYGDGHHDDDQDEKVVVMVMSVMVMVVMMSVVVMTVVIMIMMVMAIYDIATNDCLLHLI